MKNIFKYIALFLYFSMTFFLLGLAVRAGVSLIKIGELYISYEGIVSNVIKSIIAGAAITLAAIFFNLIDKYKARKKPPFNSE
ncbi:hypothetical protein [Erwinia sp. S38]|uniref:hypothetical protein n=1 Tax=Erwinia sp. S38 TaxID=2769338 RepID=UPI00190E3190|nr:hypothetical protein [Erwinia sp. S38]MBK0003575.1 hypothetical protein [Erwinia sp. S38]